jgi:hypothetical protein
MDQLQWLVRGAVSRGWGGRMPDLPAYILTRLHPYPLTSLPAYALTCHEKYHQISPTESTSSTLSHPSARRHFGSLPAGR